MPQYLLIFIKTFFMHFRTIGLYIYIYIYMKRNHIIYYGLVFTN